MRLCLDILIFCILSDNLACLSSLIRAKEKPVVTQPLGTRHRGVGGRKCIRSSELAL